MFPLATTGRSYHDVFFEHYGVNPFIDTEDDPISTFGVDVDTASYALARRYLNEGSLPDPDGIRVEEFVNSFEYDYPAPRRGVFTILFEGAPSKFGGGRYQLLRIGLKGRVISPAERKLALLTFVIDTSGSMANPAGHGSASSISRLELVKQALRLLVDNLTPRDAIGIVAYNESAQLVLPPTSVARKSEILDAIDRLQPGGSTNASAGLRLGYDLARKHFQKEQINRVLFLSDGVANVEETGADSILKRITDGVQRGITLTTAGVGAENYNDVLMEKLADKGNGQYAYLDSMAEAARVFGEGLTSTLEVIAKDVKVQVQFEERTVERYRLLGYENRDIADEQFERADGGEVGPGHSVTALYEVKFQKNAPLQGPVATVSIRWTDPETGNIRTEDSAVTRQMFGSSFETASPSFRLAAGVAEFAEILRKSYWAKGSSFRDVVPVLMSARNGVEDSAKVGELIDLVHNAITQQPDNLVVESRADGKLIIRE